MAIIATVTKGSVDKLMDKLWNVTLNMVVTDDGVEVVNKDYPLKYRPGDSIALKQAAWADLMQDDIDKYKSEQVIYNAAALTTVVSNVNAALEV